ncbi:MAG TPA: glycosyltransferase family 2 protein [Blastocatellia bacterium]|nr:glycosyltransferase family 2 protein [Blastocatellia bacterium]
MHSLLDGLPNSDLANNPRVLVTVLSYNSPAQTLQTLRSLSRQTYKNFHLLLIDNASSVEFGSLLSEEFPELEIKRLPVNLGYTGGFNVALDQGLSAGYDYVLLCNHDIEVDKDALSNLIETAQLDPQSGIIGGVEVDAHTGIERAHKGAKFSLWTGHSPWISATKITSLACRVFCVHGALVLISARALQTGIRFDEQLFMYYDEVDLGFQLQERGLKAYVDQRVKFIHKRLSTEYSPVVGYLMHRNRAYVIGKHGKWYHKLFYQLYAPLFELPAKYCLRSLQGHNQYAGACFRGHLDGLGNRMGAPLWSK